MVVRALALAVLAATAAVTLGRGVQRGTGAVEHRVRSEERAAGTAGLSYFDCLERIVVAGVPHGAKVRVAAQDDASYQRLTEIVTPHVVPVASRADAAFVLSFSLSPTGCGGTSVALGAP